MRAIVPISILLVLIAAIGVQPSGGATTVRPYKFGFKIPEQQHRSEQRDEKGIVMGEYGFITADGIYHVTVYATDEEGRFRILAMRNYPYESPPKTIDMIVKAKAPLTPPAIVKAIAPVTLAQKKGSNYNTNACSGCNLRTKAAEAAKAASIPVTPIKTDIRPLSQPFPSSKGTTTAGSESPETMAKNALAPILGEIKYSSGLHTKAIPSRPQTKSTSTGLNTNAIPSTPLREQLANLNSKVSAKETPSNKISPPHTTSTHPVTQSKTAALPSSSSQAQLKSKNAQKPLLLTQPTTVPQQSIPFQFPDSKPVKSANLSIPSQFPEPKQPVKSAKESTASSRIPQSKQPTKTAQSTDQLNETPLSVDRTISNSKFAKETAVSQFPDLKPAKTKTAKSNGTEADHHPIDEKRRQPLHTKIDHSKLVKSPPIPQNLFTPVTDFAYNISAQIDSEPLESPPSRIPDPRTESLHTHKHTSTTTAGKTVSRSENRAQDNGSRLTNPPRLHSTSHTQHGGAQKTSPAVSQPKALTSPVSSSSGASLKTGKSATTAQGKSAPRPAVKAIKTVSANAGKSPAGSVSAVARPSGGKSFSNSGISGKTASAAGGDGDLYRFKYLLDFHGHTETGSHNGNKVGNYYSIGDDNVERTIEYTANEHGYHPVIHWRRVGDAGAAPITKSKENTLKEYEFVWFNKP